MKIFPLLLIALLLTPPASAETIRYCGHLRAISYLIDDYPVTRFYLHSPLGRRRDVVVEDANLTKRMVRLVTGKPFFSHRSSADNVTWIYSKYQTTYEVCLTTPSLNQVRNPFYAVVDVISVEVYRDGKKVPLPK